MKMKRYVLKEDGSTGKAAEVAKLLKDTTSNRRVASIACIMGLLQAGVTAMDEEDRPTAWLAAMKSLEVLGVDLTEQDHYLDTMDRLHAIFDDVPLDQGIEIQLEMGPSEDKTEEVPLRASRKTRWDGYL